MTLKIESKGGWPVTEAWLRRLSRGNVLSSLSRFGPIGVNALRAATPIESSETANSWTYDIKSTATGFAIHWRNTNLENGIPIAVILQYGHGTGTGGYVEGRDYINPAIQPIFDQIVVEAMKEVTR